MTDWQPIKTMPLNQAVLVSDGALVKPGTRVADDVVTAPFAQNIGFWTHWAPYPKPPREMVAPGKVQVAVNMTSFARLEDAERFVTMIRVPEGDEVGILAVAAGNRPEDGMRFAVVQRSQVMAGLWWTP